MTRLEVYNRSRLVYIQPLYRSYMLFFCFFFFFYSGLQIKLTSVLSLRTFDYSIKIASHVSETNIYYNTHNLYTMLWENDVICGEMS